MKLAPFISLFFVALLATSSLAAAGYVTPERSLVTEVMQNYDLDNQNNSYQLACEIGQYVSEEYNWNCDIRQLNFSKHAPVYVNVLYPAADTKRGYEAYYGWFGPQKKEVTMFWGKDGKMYYKDWSNSGKECYISGLCSYEIIQSYYGNVTDENETIIEPVENVTENESMQPEENISVQDVPVIIVNDSHDTERMVLLNSDNNTVQPVDLADNEINNTVVNSTGTVNNQGIIDSVKQYFIDFKNANLSNVSFNFWG